MQPRATRWPSDWQLRLEFRHAGKRITEVTNISETGFRVRAPAGDLPKVGEQARFESFGRMIYSRVVWVEHDRLALKFREPLMAREVRALQGYYRLL